MTRTDSPSVRQVVSQGILYGTLGAGLTKASMLLSSVIVLRTLSVSEYGLWVLATALASLFSTFGFDALDRLVIAHLGRLEAGTRRAERQREFAAYARMVLAVTTALSVLFLLLAGVTRLYQGPRLVLALLAVTFLSEGVKRVVRTSFHVSLRFKTAALIDAGLRAAYVLLVVLFLLVLGWRLIGVAAAYAATSVLGAAVFGAAYLSTPRPRRAEPEGAAGGLAALARREGGWIIAGQLLHDLSRNGMPWIVGSMLGVEAAGTFGFAKNLYGEVANIVPLSTVLVPVLAHEFDDPRRFAELSRRALKYGTWMGLGVIAGMLALKPLLAVVFPAYRAALPLFYLALTSLVFQNGSVVLLYMLNSAHQQRAIFFSDLTKPAFVSTLFPALTALAGTWGAVAGLPLHAAGLFYARYAAVRRTLGWTFPWRQLVHARASEWRQAVALAGSALQRTPPPRSVAEDGHLE